MQTIANIFTKMREELDTYKASIKMIDNFIQSYEEGENAEKSIKLIQAEMWRLKRITEEKNETKGN